MRKAWIVLGFLVLAVYLFGWPHGPAKPVFSAGANAIWLGHAWVGEHHRLSSGGQREGHKKASAWRTRLTHGWVADEWCRD